jgi:hypothetical protein
LWINQHLHIVLLLPVAAFLFILLQILLMNIFSKTTYGSIGLLLLLLTACSENKQANPAVETQVKSATSEPIKEVKQKSEAETPAVPEDGPAMATIAAPEYEAKLYRAVAFLPGHDGAGMIKVKPGNRFIVLDMSVRNTSKSKEVDMGQILLSATVADEKGKEYRFNAMAVAAYTLDNPDPRHQAQYNALWGKLKPGDFYRTTVFGLEVPANAKNFVLSMKENGDIFKETKRYNPKFTVE